MFKKMLKNQKGLTLIELLVVVVILGIIAAIAIPAVGGLIENSKKDAHIANAQQMISSARLASAGGNELKASTNGTDGQISLEDLTKDGYIEPLESPWNGVYKGAVYLNDTGEFRVWLEDGTDGYSIGSSGSGKLASELERNIIGSKTTTAE